MSTVEQDPAIKARFEKAFKDWQECQMQVREAKRVRQHAAEKVVQLEKKEEALLKVYDTTPHWR